jgi:hypothetical protein
MPRMLMLHVTHHARFSGAFGKVQLEFAVGRLFAVGPSGFAGCVLLFFFAALFRSLTNQVQLAVVGVPKRGIRRNDNNPLC